MNLLDWLKETKDFGWTPAASREFRAMLRPKIHFRQPSHWPTRTSGTEQLRVPPRIKDFISWDVVLTSGENVRYYFQRIQSITGWAEALIELLPFLTATLKDCFDLMAELDGATSRYDHSYLHHPSITNHEQNQHFKDWTILIDLCRDAWVMTERHNLQLASAEYARWRRIPYPIFRRLSLFAAASSAAAVSSREAIALLSEGDAWWLWSVETQREAIRLICALATRLDAADATVLTDSISNGPPREMYRSDLTPQQWLDVRERTTWLRLAKFERCGGHLNDSADALLKVIATKYPGLQLAEDDRDEFPSYTYTGRAPFGRRDVTLPTTRSELAAALRERPVDDFFYEDNWRELLQSRFRRAVSALLQLARERAFPADAWQVALQVLSGEGLVRRAWFRLHSALFSASDDDLRVIGSAITWWIQAAANAIPVACEVAFVTGIDRLLTIQDLGEPIEPSVTLDKAINHPLGHICEALLRWWYRTGPKVGGLLPAPIVERFTRLLAIDSSAGVARVTLAAHVSNLHFVDPAWTQEHLLPHFSWNRDASIANNLWRAYLGNPNISDELVKAFKSDFLETAERYNELGEFGDQYARLLAIAFIQIADAFSITEKRATLKALGTAGLAAAAHRIADALANAGEQREEYWLNRIKPLMDQAWPKAATFRSPDESCALAEICIHAGGKFPDAFALLRPWLQPAPECRLLASKMQATLIPAEQPALALQLLAALIDVTERWVPYDLKAVLVKIEAADPSLRDTEQFRRLRQHVDQYGFE